MIALQLAIQMPLKPTKVHTLTACGICDTYSVNGCVGAYIIATSEMA